MKRMTGINANLAKITDACVLAERITATIRTTVKIKRERLRRCKRRTMAWAVGYNVRSRASV